MDLQHDNAVSKFDSPYTPGVDSAPGPPLSTNPAIVGESTVTPSPIAQQQPTNVNTTTTNVIHNPEYTPTSASTADKTVANDSPTKLEQAAPYAGPAAVAGAGAATALPREDTRSVDRFDETVNQDVNEAPEDSRSTLEKAAPYAGAAAVGGAGAAALHSHKNAEEAEEAARLDNSPNRDVPGVTDEALDGKRKGAEAAAGAALGAAGGATAVEAVKQAGGGHVSFNCTVQEASELTSLSFAGGRRVSRQGGSRCCSRCPTGWQGESFQVTSLI